MIIKYHNYFILQKIFLLLNVARIASHFFSRCSSANTMKKKTVNNSVPHKFALAENDQQLAQLL